MSHAPAPPSPRQPPSGRPPRRPYCRPACRTPRWQSPRPEEQGGGVHNFRNVEAAPLDSLRMKHASIACVVRLPQGATWAGRWWVPGAHGCFTTRARAGAAPTEQPTHHPHLQPRVLCPGLPQLPNAQWQVVHGHASLSHVGGWGRLLVGAHRLGACCGCAGRGDESRCTGVSHAAFPMLLCFPCHYPTQTARVLGLLRCILATPPRKQPVRMSTPLHAQATRAAPMPLRRQVAHTHQPHEQRAAPTPVRRQAAHTHQPHKQRAAPTPVRRQAAHTHQPHEQSARGLQHGAEDRAQAARHQHARHVVHQQRGHVDEQHRHEHVRVRDHLWGGVGWGGQRECSYFSG